jgi:hypothetical protein
MVWKKMKYIAANRRFLEQLINKKRIDITEDDVITREKCLFESCALCNNKRREKCREVSRLMKKYMAYPLNDGDLITHFGNCTLFGNPPKKENNNETRKP